MKLTIKNKGFTLIELLAVIIILGVLLLIAVPSVSRYITESRKKTLTTTIGNYTSALVTEVNNLDYKFTERNVVYAVPIECIELERGGQNPFGEWLQASDHWAYVLVQYDYINSSHIYGFTFKDSSGYGMYPTSQDKLQESGSQIQGGLNLNEIKPYTGTFENITEIKNWTGFNINRDTKLVVLESSETGSNGQTTCKLVQKGKNYDTVKQEQTNAASNKPCEVTRGTGYDVGDVITCKVKMGNTETNEKFNIVSSDKYTITMLKYVEIKESNYPDFESMYTYNGATLDHWNSYSQTVFNKDNDNYWNFKLSEYGGSYPAYVYDSNAYIYQIVEAYETDMKKTVKSASARLISYEELINLCGDTSSCSDAPAWVTYINSITWTGTAKSRNEIYRWSGINIGRHPVSGATGKVRPIVTISRSEV